MDIQLAFVGLQSSVVLSLFSFQMYLLWIAHASVPATTFTNLLLVYSVSLLFFTCLILLPLLSCVFFPYFLVPVHRCTSLFLICFVYALPSVSNADFPYLSSQS